MKFSPDGISHREHNEWSAIMKTITRISILGRLNVLICALSLAACTPGQVAQTTAATRLALVTGQLVCAARTATAAMASAEGAPILAATLTSAEAARVCGYIRAVPATLPQAAADVLATVPWAVRQDAAERLGIMSVTAGSPRVIRTDGLRRFDLGNGVAVYTNNPDAVTYFGWNTGSSAGSVNGIGR